MATAVAESTGSNAIGEIIDQGKFTLPQIVIICVCVILNILDGFDVTTIAVGKTAIAADLGLSASQLGYLDAIALAGMCLGAMFLGALSDLVGRRRVILTSITGIAIAMFLTALAQNFIQFFIIRLITGLGVGAMLASIAATASEYSPIRFKSLSVTLATAGYPLGATLGGVVGPGLIESWGWQGVFFFGAGATGVVALTAFFLLPESPYFLISRQPDNALEQVNKILAKIGKQQLDVLPAKESEVKTGFLNTLFGIFKNSSGLFRDGLWRKTLLLWAVFFCCFISLYFLMSWIPYLIEQSGYSRQQGGVSFSLFNIGAVIGIVVLGVLSTKFRLSPTVASFLSFAAILMVVFAYIDVEIEILMSMIFLIGFFMQSGFTGLYACAAKIYPSEIKATGLGWAIGLGRLGAVVGPAMAGVLIDSGVGMQANFIIFAVPLLLGGLMAYALRVD